MKLLKFYATWCAPCKALSTIVESTDQSLIEVEDVDIEAQRELAISFGIRGVPTCVIVDSDNKEIRRKVGMMSESEYINFVKGI
jgi:thioredoxin 1